MIERNTVPVIEIDESSGIPIWLQLRNRLIYLIRSGYYQEGDRLPTMRDMAVSLNINYNTVCKVYNDMEDDGYLVSRRAKGTFVSHLPEDMSRASEVEELAKDFIRQCREMGVEGDEVIDLVARVLHPEDAARRNMRIVFSDKGDSNGLAKGAGRA